MLRDVLIAVIGRGQFPTALVAIGVIISIVWVPQHNWAIIIKSILRGLQNGSLLGYVLSIVIAIGWWKYVRSMQRQHSEEVERLNQEINNLKSKQL